MAVESAPVTTGSSFFRKLRPSRVALLVVTAWLAVLWIVPIAWAVATSLKPRRDDDRSAEVAGVHDHPRRVPEGPRHRGHLPVALNSTVIALGVTVLTVLTASMAAYAFAAPSSAAGGGSWA